jgi:RimJ/RimL family protein N-acetyltransferase
MPYSLRTDNPLLGTRAVRTMGEGLANTVRMRLAKDGRQVTLRRAKADDVLVVYDWQREPTTRRFSRNPLVPELEEHSRWFSKRLKSKDCMLFIIEHDRKPAGVLRFDRLAVESPSTWEISIFIAPDKMRLGIASGALDLGRALLAGAELVAEVLPANRTSRSLFRAAGYSLESDGRFHCAPVKHRYKAGAGRVARSSRSQRKLQRQRVRVS